MFSVAYVLDGAPKATRPVAFVWNGGPGSSSMWLHLGAFGPYRVDMPDARSAAIPARLVPNDGTLLGATDLVFVDAPGTGYSRIAGKGKPEQFYGIDEDARAFTQFIQRWLTANGRWASPKVLIGESYGTTRASNVANRLQTAGVGLNGVALISSALDLSALDPAPVGQDLSNLSFLPTEAAVAWYHDLIPGGRPASLEAFVNEARTFAFGPYATALLQGNRLDAATRRSVIAQLHRFIGLDEGYIDRADLRIDPARFEAELQRSRGLLTGRLDGRYASVALDRNADSPQWDPTDIVITPAFTTAFNTYVREDLKFDTDAPYKGTNYGEVGSAFHFYRTGTASSEAGYNVPGAPSVVGDLQRALATNPRLQVFAANGYYDLATPFFGTELLLAHMDAGSRARVHYGYYPSGHMIYLEPRSRTGLRADLDRFIRDAAAR